MEALIDALYVNPRQAHRLVTHEDAAILHMHKILGALCLGNFTYRMWNWYNFGTLGFDSSYWTLGWIVIHALLHISSFQFIIPNRRNRVYNIIWPEMRIHSMLFAYRSLLVMLIMWFYDRGIADERIMYLRGPVVIGTMILADATTRYYKVGDTTMRNNPYPDYAPSWFIKAHNLFYSISQVFATINMLFKGTDLAFLALIPIQTAPFCMTLVKKGIINQAGWHLYYTIALFINYRYALCNTIQINIRYLVMFFVMGRFVFNSNKYVLWSMIILAQVALMHDFIGVYMTSVTNNISVCY